MIRGKSRFPVWLCLAIFAAGGAVAAADNGSTIFPGLADSAESPGWKPARQTMLRKTAFERPANPPAAEPALSPTFPQIPNALESPSVEISGVGNAAAGHPSAADSCPECGAALEHPPADKCGRCLRPVGRFFHLLSPRDWLRGDAAQRAQREPWLYRPFSAGLFMGPIVGSPLVNDTITQETGFLAGGAVRLRLRRRLGPGNAAGLGQHPACR